MEYFIYMTTNSVNGMKYIGQHKGSIDDKYLGSGIWLQKALAKEGKEAFSREILEICTRENIDEREKHWIKYYDAVNRDDFYNLAKGGQNGDGWAACYNYFKEHPEEADKLYKQNGERLQEWVKENPDKVQQNVQAMLDGNKKWRKENPEAVQAQMQKVQEAKEKWQSEHPQEYQQQVEFWRAAGSLANSKKIKCTTTGEIFDSISAAGRAYGVPQGNISKVLLGERKSAGTHPETKEKLKWEYV